MELKLTSQIVGQAIARFNRTFMELKFADDGTTKTMNWWF